MEQFEDIEHWSGSVKRKAPSLTIERSEPEIAEPKEPKDQMPWRLIGLILTVLLAIFAATVVGYLIGRAERSNQITTNDQPTQDSQLATNELPPLAMASLEPRVAKDNEPWMVAKLENYQFEIKGVVKTEEEKQQITEMVGRVYADRTDIDIRVNPDIAASPWGENLIPVLRQISVSFINGAVALNADTTIAVGLSPQAEAEQVEGQLAGLQFQNIQNEVVASDQLPPQVDVTLEDRVLKISGRLPTQEFINLLVNDIEAACVEGQLQCDRVENTLTADPSRFAKFGFLNFRQNLIVFEELDQFVLGVDGGAIYAEIANEAAFTQGSTTLTEDGKRFLDKYLVLAQVRSDRVLEITGYTDSVGSEELNNDLSLKRAQAAGDYLVSIGFDPTKVLTKGLGESNPIGDNSTEEGRAKNRRVSLDLLAPNQSGLRTSSP